MAKAPVLQAMGVALLMYTQFGLLCMWVVKSAQLMQLATRSDCMLVGMPNHCPAAHVACTCALSSEGWQHELDRGTIGCPHLSTLLRVQFQ